MVKKPEEAEAPAIDVTQTPEFQRVLNAAVSKAVAGIRDELAAARAQAGSSSTDEQGDMRLARTLALAIAEISDQGTSRKRVAPEVLAKREQSGEEMKKLILAARANGLTPTYKLISKVYLDEMLVEPLFIDSDHKAKPVEIEWPGVPNEAMKPSNEVAATIFAAYKGWIGSTVTPVPDPIHSVTAGGLVIKGQLWGRELRQTGEGEHAGEGLKVRGRGGRTVGEPINILGTVAPPARQGA